MGGKGCLCCYLPFLCRWQPFAIFSAYILSCTSWSLIVFAFYSDLVTVLLLRIYAFQEKTWGNLVCILVISLHIVSGYYDCCIYWSQVTFFVSRAHIEPILTSFC